MYYTIGDIAKKMNLPTSTIRFYDKQGLLPFLERDKNGRRRFKENDLNFLRVITCLKKSGVSVDVIAKFVGLCMEGDATLKERFDYLSMEESNLVDKITDLSNQLEYLRYKKWYYEKALEAGTESVNYVEGTTLVNPNLYNEYLSLTSNNAPQNT